MPNQHLEVQRGFCGDFALGEFFLGPEGAAALGDHSGVSDTGHLYEISFCTLFLLPNFLGSYAQESNSPNLNSQTAADQAQPKTEADQSRLDQTELAPTSTTAAPQV